MPKILTYAQSERIQNYGGEKRLLAAGISTPDEIPSPLTNEGQAAQWAKPPWPTETALRVSRLQQRFIDSLPYTVSQRYLDDRRR